MSTTMTPAEVLAVMDEWITANNNNRPRKEPKVRMDRELEAARAAVAALVAEHARMYEALTWALGANGDFRTQRTMEGPYYWRGELAERAGLFWNGERYLHRPTSAALAGAGR